MSPRTIAIGDIHGCSPALNALLNAISPQPEDVVITLGDYIDRGPDTPGVVDRLIALRDECQLRPLLGNHEAMLLMAIEESTEIDFWVACGGKQTLEAYGGELAGIPESHRRFFHSCQPYAELDEYFCVHANYTPSLPLDQQPEYVLLWEHLTDHLPGLHYSGKKAIVGHTPQRDGDVLRLDHLICIDTYCYGSGWLTALDIESQVIWQANRDGELRS